MSKVRYVGMLMGVVVDGDGTPAIAFDISGKKVAMSIEQAGFFMEQLGNTLEVLGYFDGEEPEGEVVPVITTKH